MSVNPADQDPVVRQFREQISDNDRVIVEAVNRRLKLVQRLWSYKASRGYDLLAPSREDWMLQYLSRANRGPLSAEGLRQIYTAVLDLTKRELNQPVVEEPASEAEGHVI